MNCAVCDKPLTGRQKAYCSRRCNSSADGQRRVADGRMKAQRERHADRIRTRQAARTWQRTCSACDTTFTAKRYETVHCSRLCSTYARKGPQSCPVPTLKPAAVERLCGACESWFQPRLHTQTYCTQACRDRASERRKYAKIAALTFKPEPRVCNWCGLDYLARAPHATVCSHRCGRKQSKAKRRAVEVGSPGTYTWAEVMRLFVLFDRRCAYCEQPIDGQPDPDHVVPLSRGGDNGITNIVPACRSCNGDKRNLLLTEWAADRARRGKPAVRTCLPLNDRRFRHLTSTLLDTAA